MKGSAFKIPTIDEVKAFMNLCKPDWPTNFINYLADKWLAHYMSNGFIVGRVKMKDWKSCIRAQWLTLKYKEDKDLLEKYLMEPVHQMHAARMRRQADGMYAEQFDPTAGSAKSIDYYIEYYETMRGKFFAGGFKNPEKELAPHYDRLKAMGVMRLPKAQIDRILVDMGNDRDRGKGMSVIQLFNNLQAKGLTMKEYHRQIVEKMQPQ